MRNRALPCIMRCVSISSLFERNCLDHRADILQDAEGQGVLGINRRAGECPVNRAPSKDKRERTQLHLVLRHSHHDELAAGCKTGHKWWPHSITTGGLLRESLWPRHTLQYRCGILDSSIDVDVRAQTFRKLFLVPSTPRLRQYGIPCAANWIPRCPRPPMPCAATRYSPRKSALRDVVGRDTRAQERGGFCGPELI